MRQFHPFFLILFLWLPTSSQLQAQQGSADELDEPWLSETQALALAIETEDYWTQERMSDAEPLTPDALPYDRLPEPLIDEPGEAAGEKALPGFAPGWRPGQGAQPETGAEFTIEEDDPLYPIAAGIPGGNGELAQPQHGSAPSNPRNGPYPPFQRWTEFDSIAVYPKSTHGKLFFRRNGSSFVCSATVIQRNTLITAGHCNSDGNGNFASRRLFCPSYRNRPHPTRDCWPVIASKTSSRWHNRADPDYDYACLVTRPTGREVANSVGNVTGWLGRAWNFGSRQSVRTFGYPAAAPFNGRRLVTTASTEWYSLHFQSGGQSSKFIGSDLTGGSSGGSWVLGWHRPGHEFADSDGRPVTDPAGNHVNGVNSHKRCRSNCDSPPTTSQGVFWQEMSSPQFRRTSARDESEDIIRVCLNNGGT